MQWTSERKNRWRILFSLAVFAGVALADDCPVNEPTGVIATYPGMPGSQFPGALKYPKISDRYAVQYSVGGGPWTLATVNISYYGGSTSTPFLSNSQYAADTSMSFVSIPARASASVQLRVTKLFGTPFRPSDHVSVRPTVKLIDADTLSDGSVLISTATRSDFAGEQFLLWWDGNGAQGGGIQSLVFFLNPPYQPPTGSVKTIKGWGNLADVTGFDSLDFEGTVVFGANGDVAYQVPDNIHTIYLGPGSWVQGKFQFTSGGTATQKKTIYGPGVLDVSRFRYDLRVCNNASLYPDQGVDALSVAGGASSLLDNAPLDEFLIDGIVITDHNHAATDTLANSTVNNVKTLGWNAVNGGLRIGNNTTVSNQFIRSGDDSLMVWGSNLTVSNATVWQNYNGGVVNLGWSDNSKGENVQIDGLYVVKTDWHTPTSPSWKISDAKHTLNDQNNAVFASMMIPTTQFDKPQNSVFRNIFVEDPPQVLFSLKIMPSNCGVLIGFGSCPPASLRSTSLLNLNIENLFSPQSVVSNSIGFDTVQAGYINNTITPPETFSSDYTLAGMMNIGLTNVFIRLPFGLWLPLTSADALAVGQIHTNGDNVNIKYGLQLP